MSLDKRKREVQLEAGKAWKDSGYRGTIELNTGGGKTFIAFDAMVDLPKGSKVLFLAETNQREIDVKKDSEVYLSFFGINPLSHVNFEFACYQSAYKWKNRHWDLVICDEVQDSLSKEHYKFFRNNSWERILCLTATTNARKIYVIDGKRITKGEMLDAVAPICYSYDLADALRDNIGRKLNIYVIRHELDNVTKNIKAGSKDRPFMQTEKKQYDYLDNNFYSAVDKNIKGYIHSAMNKRTKFLMNLPSKIVAAKRVLKVLKGKTIIFNDSLDTLEQVTPNVVRSGKEGRSKKEQDEINTYIREAFDKGTINTIGSAGMLQQGANLKGVDNEIIMSLTSKSGGYIQKWGRLRKNLEVEGIIVIFVTQSTQEVEWWNRAIADIPMEEFNVIECNGIDECINKLK